ncbi:MAG: hypothetical protein HUU46_02630 [Candidatus Hydrogenedentes bacterium]|nr:hypothetical protein [Candidatus Hydrogenedentota bacterium]
MHATNPFLIFTSRFDAIGVRYMITGSVAATFYGEPRLTNDVDIVADVPDSAVPALADAFPLADFYLPPEEIIRVENVRPQRGHFNIIHHTSGLKADVYLAGKDALAEWGLDHCRRADFGEATVSIAPPEYVIVRKLEFYREGQSEKHLRDIRAIVEAVSPELDVALIEKLARERGLSDIWDSVKT